jgi:hypothetical protein
VAAKACRVDWHPELPAQAYRKLHWIDLGADAMLNVLVGLGVAIRATWRHIDALKAQGVQSCYVSGRRRVCGLDEEAARGGDNITDT